MARGPAKDSDWAHLAPGHMTGDASDGACVWHLCAAALKSLCCWPVCVVTTWVVEGVCALWGEGGDSSSPESQVGGAYPSRRSSFSTDDLSFFQANFDI